MKRNTAASSLAVLAFAGLAIGQPIEKNGNPCTFTRSNAYDGVTVAPTMGSTNWNIPTTGTPGGIIPPTSYTSLGAIQVPMTPQQSINCVLVPPGLKAQIVASELTPGPGASLGYLMYFTFDERGRVWAVEPRDYPYTHYTAGGTFTTQSGIPTNRLTGQGRVIILEDTNGDGALDNYKVFHNSLALPTSIEVVKNGVIVTVPPFIYYLPKSATNPDTSGPVVAVVSSFASSSTTYDTHGQSNSLTRGLDNWIYVHNGYTGCGTPAVLGGNTLSGCSANGPIHRFKQTQLGSDTNRIELVAPATSRNAHGIGQMEDGQWFKSHATNPASAGSLVNSHSQHVVRGMGTAVNETVPNASGGTGNTHQHRYYALTQDRYMWEGQNLLIAASGSSPNYYASRNSAVTGHDFYTARLLPQKYWNRFGFTCEGASGLCNQDSLVESGSTWTGHRLYPPNRIPNVFASTDAWAAPLKVRTGPDGALWVLDFYNYLFLHNPATPAQNAAWISNLRRKSRVRLYRIIPENGATDPVLNLSSASTVQLVSTLYHSNFVWRLQAQRLLIEQGYTAELGNLLDSILTKHRQVDAVGIDGPVLHALWTLHGLKRFDVDSARWNPKLRNLLLHPAWTVRRNVVLAMPATEASYASIREQCAVNDVHAHVRVQALQNLTRIPASGTVMTSVEGLRTGDTYIAAAFTAATTSKVTSVSGSGRPGTCPAYLDTASWTVGVRGGAPLRFQRADVRFDLRTHGFDLSAAANLPSGELVVTDLRGRTAFRSTFNKATGWSQASAANLTHPFYFYTFRGVNGDTFSGRIAMAQTF